MSQEVWTQADMKRHMNGGYVRPKPANRPCPERLEIVIPIPPKETSPNARCHWAKKANAARMQKQDAGTAIKMALIQGNYNPPEWQRAEVQATFWRSRTGRALDQDNALAWLKNSLDALQDLRIVVNDSGLTHLPPIQRLGKDAGGRNEVVLDIRGIVSGGTCQ